MNRINQNKKVLVAMSGGVDSSVALYLLREQGYDVSGATMKLWDYRDVGGAEHSGTDGGCCDLRAINDAREVCDRLGVHHYVLDFSEEFRQVVIENFVAEYMRGRTPNPCVLCNTKIKWEMFLQRAQSIGCNYIATGHYAITGLDEDSGRYYLKRGADSTRDQAYALWGLSQEALAHTFLPLGNLKKSETRTIADRAGLKTAEVTESMEICFVSDNDYGRFIREWTGQSIPTGNIIDESGNVIGTHKGIPFYTVGQRRGLGIAHPTPLYVTRIQPAENLIIVGEKKDVNSQTLTLSAVNWVSRPPLPEPFTGLTQIRYQHNAQPSVITPLSENRLRVDFDEPQLAITPGQSAVIFDNDVIIAGGIID